MRRVILIITMACLFVPAEAELRAGVSTIDITPPTGGRMGGYGERGANATTGVHDALMAKALVLKDRDTALVIVALDLLATPPDAVDVIKQGILEKTGIGQVMLLASHTYSGPDQNARFPSPEKPWMKEFVDKVVNTVVTANESLSPVRYGVGKGEVAEGHNRRRVKEDGTYEMLWRNAERIPTEPVDYAVGVIRFETHDGAPLATLVNFTCHPAVLGPDNLEFSADYPGVLTRTVEQELGGTCLFANGAFGDINPYMDKTAPKNGGFEEAERMGKVLAGEAVRVSKSLAMNGNPDVELTAETETVPMAMRWDYNNPEVVAVFEKKHGKTLVSAFLKALRENVPASLVGDLVTVTLGNDLAIVGLPGEFFVELGLDLKRRCAIPNTFVFGDCNKTFNCFPTINATWQVGERGAKQATLVAVGTGEQYINKALINLYLQTGRLSNVPSL